MQYAQSNPGAFGGGGVLHMIFIGEVWRGMFGAEMLPALLFFMLLFFVPESPRWLIKSGAVEAGFNQLTRISGAETARRELAEIQYSLAREEGTLAELFRPGLRLALLVGVMLSVFGQLSGVNIVVYYGPKILGAAGFTEVATLLGQVGFGLINLIFTILAMLFIDRLGRRPLLIGGMAVVTVSVAIIGALFLTTGSGAELGEAAAIPRATGIWIGVMICIYIAAIAFSICAVIWVITPEIFPNRVRGRAASLCTFANWSSNAFAAFAFPWFVSSFGMHTGFFTAAAICLVATVFFWKFVPETKGRSLEEIENLWQAGNGKRTAATPKA
jgi:SP family arabinose:H+ symporter-like MFS transporter